jgi:hypothetical protein
VTHSGFGDCLDRVPGCYYRARPCLVARVTSDPPTMVDYINGSTEYWPSSIHASSFLQSFSIVNIFYPDRARQVPCDL